jgi:molybdopterin-synthase adenylyltransferase
MKERTKRQSFLGSQSDKVLGDCCVAIVGLGGGGSHIAQQLAHLGVGNFFLIDPDRVEESNLNRLVGATAEDAAHGTRKTLVASRLIAGINPLARVSCVAEKWQESHEFFRGSDIIFACLDTYGDRYELEVAARRYLVPLLDLGMDVHEVAGGFSVSGQVILSMPGCLCMRCLGFLRDDLIAKEAANYGVAGRRPQVVWANGALASAAIGVFTQLFTPWHRAHADCVYLEYDGNNQMVATSNRLLHMRGKQCPHFLLFSDLGDPFWIPEQLKGDEDGEIPRKG